MTPTDERERQLDRVLELWAIFMNRAHLGLGYPGHAAGMAAYRTSQDFDELADQAEIQMAQAVDAALDDLPRLQRDAVATALLRSRWRHAAVEYSNSLAAARAALAERLAKRGVL